VATNRNRLVQPAAALALLCFFGTSAHAQGTEREARPIAASAAAAPIHAAATRTREPKTAVVDDAALYAQRERQSPRAATFEGGGQGVYIGGSALTVVLIILLIVIVL
jgi:hypothetical protein